jgi:hypothetical protein
MIDLSGLIPPFLGGIKSVRFVWLLIFWGSPLACPVAYRLFSLEQVRSAETSTAKQINRLHRLMAV